MVKKVRTASLRSANRAVSGGKKVNHTISPPSSPASTHAAFSVPGHSVRGQSDRGSKN